MNLLDTLNSQWAITEDALNQIVSAYQTHINGEGADIEGLAALHGRAGSGSRQGPFVESGVAVIDILGILAKNENIFMKIFGGTPLSDAGEQFRQAVVDPDVKAEDILEVGNYAIQVLWSDLHYLGIFPFRVLRGLCPCAECQTA